MNVDYPFHIDARGRSATADRDTHIRDMIEQVLFTQPGERVNRPSFGCGLLQMVFGPNSPEIASATSLLVQSALQQWLGDLIQVDSVDAASEDSTLSVKVVYTVRLTGRQQQAQFERQV